ncbi:MAG: phage antirepressor KilAC domain-containing protein [Sandaracinaceae bacterium]|nr:phage antirepressor KilAC domain-containing protein [Sandaracinaceae bacterium]
MTKVDQDPPGRNSITQYTFEDANVRVIVSEDGGVSFVASDACNVLGIGNTSDGLRRLEDDEKGVDSIDTLGGRQMVSVVSEAGLYSLILGSRKPEAKRFKRWVTHDVLPSIRKTGGYGKQDTLAALSDPATLRLLLGDYAGRLQALEADVDAARPKVEVYDRIVASDDTLGFREAAKLVREATGANEPEFRSLMLHRGWIQRLGGRPAPAHYGIDRGYTTSRLREIPDGEGGLRTKTELRITPKGLARAIQLLMKEAA